MKIELVQIWTIPKPTPLCARCNRLAAQIQGFEFSLDGKRVCPECALGTGFTVEAVLLNRVLHAFTYRKGRAA